MQTVNDVDCTLSREKVVIEMIGIGSEDPLRASKMPENEIHSQRPSQSSQGYDLLFLFVLQNIRHVARGYLPSRCCECPGRFF